MAAILQTTLFKCIIMNENIWISMNISLEFGSKGPINIINWFR